MKTILALLLVLNVTHSFAAENKSPEAVAVDNACTEEAKVAGCGSEKVGTGLRKCIHAYKKEHKDFKLSDNCHSSLKVLHQEQKDKKNKK